MRLKIAESEEDLIFLYETRIHPHVCESLIGSPPKDYLAHLKYIQENNRHTRFIYIAEVDGERVGYSQIYNFTENSLEVGFVIHPGYQGKGLGGELVRETVKQALAFNKKITLCVLCHNLKGIHIYEKNGFKLVGREGNTLFYEYN